MSPPLKTSLLVLGITLFFSMNSSSTPPEWWGSSGVTNSSPASNKSPANIGQAKHMAKSALDALRKDHPTLADLIEADLVGPGKIIPSWDAPTTDAESEKQHAVLLIGQLKAISHPFYQHLNSFDTAWLQNQRIYNGTNQTDSIFPWTSITTDDNNKAVANLGQLKAVFSLRFDLMGGVDLDGDGLTNEVEVAMGLSPVLYDTDGDGVPDHLDLFPLDPSRWDAMTPTAGDTTSPLVVLNAPVSAVFVSGP